MLLITVLTAQLFMIYRITTFARHMSAWNQTPEGAKRGRRKVWGLAVGLGLGWVVCVGACAANMAVFYVCPGVLFTAPLPVWESPWDCVG